MTEIPIDKRRIQQLLSRDKVDSKNSAGCLLLVAGSTTFPMAAYLSAAAALRSGAGVVHLAVPKAIIPALSQHAMEYKLIAIDEQDPGQTLLQNTMLVRAIQYSDVIMMGPGMDFESYGVALLESMMALIQKQHPHVKMVFDSAALTLLFPKRNQYAMTNHDSIWIANTEELEIVFGANPLVTDKLIANLVQQEPITWISKIKQGKVFDSTNPLFINTTGNNTMAVSGMGDVLCGMVASFVAQGLTNYEASCLALYLRGKIGDYLAKIKSIGLLPTDIINTIPNMLSQLTE